MCAYAASGKPSDRAMEIYARFNAQRKKANGSADFNDYLRIRIIGNTGNRVKGDAFEARMVKKFNMVGPDRWCQDPVPYKDPKTGKTKHRIMDSAFASTDAGRVLLEADPQLKHVYVYTGGGVDFSKSPKRNITRVEFGLEHPGLDKTTRTSVQTVTTYRDTDTVFLGGNSNGTRPTSPGGDDPAPSRHPRSRTSPGRATTRRPPRPAPPTRPAVTSGPRRATAPTRTATSPTPAPTPRSACCPRRPPRSSRRAARWCGGHAGGGPRTNDPTTQPYDVTSP